MFVMRVPVFGLIAGDEPPPPPLLPAPFDPFDPEVETPPVRPVPGEPAPALDVPAPDRLYATGDRHRPGAEGV